MYNVNRFYFIFLVIIFLKFIINLYGIAVVLKINLNRVKERVKKYSLIN
ncbi:hypothetical protein CJD_0979 [Clostridium perfringens D str. JGS1721]|uniref:Uncharacterized protein n=1 Tax=Clostridium perfringens D str. JGS1721 TaxID=488537 RepID=B1V3H7_CLOPF|nr:hypothetical protein CJD_0979 [Clostridium perfringens D str. JGS1721]